MDILLAQKAADIERLKKKVDLLQKLVTIYEKLDLTAAQQDMLDQMASILFFILLKNKMFNY